MNPKIAIETKLPMTTPIIVPTSEIFLVELPEANCVEVDSGPVATIDVVAGKESGVSECRSDINAEDDWMRM